jgi:hypothetical protein
MAEPRELLVEAGSTLARAQALIERAGVALGHPFHDPLSMLARDVEACRRRLRTASLTATGKVER